MRFSIFDYTSRFHLTDKCADKLGSCQNFTFSRKRLAYPWLFIAWPSWRAGPYLKDWDKSTHIRNNSFFTYLHGITFAHLLPFCYFLAVWVKYSPLFHIPTSITSRNHKKGLIQIMLQSSKRRKLAKTKLFAQCANCAGWPTYFQYREFRQSR